MKHYAGNGADMKANNQNAILNILCQHDISCTEIARRLGLTRASVSNHTNELISNGLVLEIGAGESGKKGRGRKPTLLGINQDYGYVGGLYISRGACFVGLTDMKGDVLISAPVQRPADAAPTELLKSAVGILSELIIRANVSGERVIGLGVSVPGPVDTVNGIMLSPPDFKKWHNFPLTPLLSSMTGMNVLMENNATSLTLAEMRFGHGRDLHDFVYLVVDSGIGGGLVIGGKLFKGKNGFGSEIGHTSIMMNGRLCSCGNSGCLERYASIPVLLSEAFSNDEGMDSWRKIVDAAENNDEHCLTVMDREAEYLSTALVDIINVLEPEAVVFGGDLLYKPSLITRLLHDRIKNRMITRGYRDFRILPSALSDETGVQAAATVVLNDFFSRGETTRPIPDPEPSSFLKKITQGAAVL